MKTLKFIFSFFILGIIITAVFGYIFYSKYSLEKIINKIELEKNINQDEVLAKLSKLQKKWLEEYILAGKNQI